MAQAEGVVKFIRDASGACDGTPDAELVRRFASSGDEQAFRALVSRYGPVVWAVCRRLVRNHHDAEDAFQAVLFVFARKAKELRAGAAVGGWLHAVAYRVASRVRATPRAEPAEVDPANGPPNGPLDELAVREAEVALHEELARLPEKYRGPLLLCCLEGLSRDEAASRLGWSVNRVKHGLEQGRELLRSRLARRGVVLGVPLLTGVLATPAGALPPGVAETAVRYATGTAPPAAVSSLALGVTRTMWLSKWKWTLAACAALLLATGGAFAAVLRAEPEPPAAVPEAPAVVPAVPAVPAQPPAPPPAKPAKEQKAAWDIATEFLQLALDGKSDEALKRCVPGTVSENKLRELRDIGYKETKLTAVLLNDLRAEIVLQKHTSGEGTKKLEGYLILMLTKKADGPWQVKDIDFRDAERVKTLLEGYLNGKYDAKPKK